MAPLISFIYEQEDLGGGGGEGGGSVPAVRVRLICGIALLQPWCHSVMLRAESRAAEPSQGSCQIKLLLLYEVLPPDDAGRRRLADLAAATTAETGRELSGSAGEKGSAEGSEGSGGGIMQSMIPINRCPSTEGGGAGVRIMSEGFNLHGHPAYQCESDPSPSAYIYRPALELPSPKPCPLSLLTKPETP